ncbi:hypothetical protein [Vulcaniibacterium tengchongense]|uniref:Uncharacterized protein n=1 Tax=Vulcaniibacterium tengchongense TaxID=1273429 RepID=A0A3N4VRK9_9GAMM|nr:hypothetical protein [Vulcaniibacterium tengchongense]RPE81851.1 hypothetical protein EDC50_1053 [Vulcaniibacterium tengchongense]
MLTYEQFLTTPADDIRQLNLLAMGQKIEFNNADEAAAMLAQCERLRTAGLIVRLKHAKEAREGVEWQSFEAIVDPVAAVYLARCAAERVLHSTDLLPTA